MCRTTGYLTALVGLTLMIAASAQNVNPAFAKFKRAMIPKIGQKITVVGTLHDGKQGFWLAFNDWGAYIYPANESGIAKANSLYPRFRSGQIVKVTGTLRHFAEQPKTKEESQARSVQRPPEHFFFDAAEVEMSVDPQGH